MTFRAIASSIHVQSVHLFARIFQLGGFFTSKEGRGINACYKIFIFTGNDIKRLRDV